MIDLDGATLTDAHRVSDLVDALASIAPQVSLVCGRLTARRLLRSARAAGRLTVFPTLSDALRRPWTDPTGAGAALVAPTVPSAPPVGPMITGPAPMTGPAA